MTATGRTPRRKRRRSKYKDPATQRLEEFKCWHRWSVFVAGKDNQPWAYCVKCGALHPGEHWPVAR